MTFDRPFSAISKAPSLIPVRVYGKTYAEQRRIWLKEKKKE